MFYGVHNKHSLLALELFSLNLLGIVFVRKIVYIKKSFLCVVCCPQMYKTLLFLRFFQTSQLNNNIANLYPFLRDLAEKKVFSFQTAIFKALLVQLQLNRLVIPQYDIICLCL